MNKNMVVILLLFALGGCTKNYKVAPLKPLKKDQAHFIQVQNGVELRAKQLPTFLGLGVMHLDLINRSDEVISLKRADISCKTFTQCELASLEIQGPSSSQKSTARAGVLGLVSFAALPFVMYGLGVWCNEAAGALAGLIIGPAVLLASPFVLGYAGYIVLEANRSTYLYSRYEFLKKWLLSSLIIEPGESAQALIVGLRKSLRKPFVCNVHAGDRLVPFEVNLGG
jgi:hypothetical protein